MPPPGFHRFEDFNISKIIRLPSLTSKAPRIYQLVLMSYVCLIKPTVAARAGIFLFMHLQYKYYNLF